MKKKAFSLIEMLVVLGIVSILLPAVFAIIFGIMREQVKVKRLTVAKEQGDYALNVIENNIRNYAFSIHSASPPTDVNEICNTASSSNAGPLYFQDRLGNWFGYSLSSNMIASSSSLLGAPVNLNSSQTIISNLSLSCTRSAVYSAPIVSIVFDICYSSGASCLSTRPEEVAQLRFQTKIKLRNF